MLNKLLYVEPTVGTGSVPVDPYWDYVSLYITGDGVANSTTFTDSSKNNVPVVVNGNTKVSTSFKKYGSGSIALDGSGDTLTFAANSVFLLNNDFTIEAWVYPITQVQSYPAVVNIGKQYGQGENICMYFNHQSAPSKYIVYFNSTLTLTGTITKTLNVWHHVALVRSGNTVSLFVDGVLDVTASYSSTTFTANPTACIGSEDAVRGITDFSGYIDEVRITKGVARYVTNFTVPSTAYPTISTTSTVTYVDDVFNTYVYTGTGSTQIINNGINLSGSGGMVWIKSRNIAGTGPTSTAIPTDNHYILDTVRTNQNALCSSSNYAQDTSWGSSYFNFLSNGFDTGTAGGNWTQKSTANYVAWSFRKAAKFFDIVTYTGTGTARTINHNLGSVPGCIMIKRLDSTSDWSVYHTGLSSASYSVQLNLGSGQVSDTTVWNSTQPTSTVFSVGTNATVNASGGTYIAYIFANNAGGFGLSGTDSIISCGSFTSSYPSATAVTLGWEPQWILVKNITGSDGWYVVDCMRGFYNTKATTNSITGNSPVAEYTWGSLYTPTPTGFACAIGGSGTAYLYIAIRRSNKAPISGTQVFAPVLYTGNSGNQSIQTGFPVDLEIVNPRSAQGWNCGFIDRMRGPGRYLTSNSNGAEVDSASSVNQFQSNTGTNRNSVYFNASPTMFVDYAFKRATGFFDIATWVGTGTSKTVNHNLGVIPELIIVKHREVWPGQTWTFDWTVYYGLATSYLVLNSTAGSAADTGGNNRFGALATSTVFTVGNVSETNSAGGMNYVGYLFATLAGVSKVGTYTGNGTSLTVNCGFTGGARFIMIKCTSTTGDWFVWDTVRGIVAANDPHSSLNTNTAEVTTDDSVDPDNSGFIINQNSATNINVTSATYIYLAIS